MTARCDELVDFADGELPADRADAFRDHLDTCDACQAGLLEAMQLHARLSELSPRPHAADVARPVDVAPSLEAPGSTDGTQPAPVPALSRRPVARSRWQAWGAASAVPVAALATLIWCRTREPDGPGVASSTPVDRMVVAEVEAVEQEHVFGAATTRPFAIRLALPGAGRHRPARPSLRDASDPSQRHVAAGDLLARDPYTWAIAQVWNHGSIPDATDKLAALAATPALTNDLVALRSLGTSEDDLDPELAALERLRTSPDLAAARAARWNYALLLTQLELPLSAAEAFRAIAAEGEPGWSDEARGRAVAQQARAQVLLDAGAPAAVASLRAAHGMTHPYAHAAPSAVVAESAPGTTATTRAYAHEAALIARPAPPTRR